MVDATCLRSLQMLAPITRETCRAVYRHQGTVFSFEYHLLNLHRCICMKLQFSLCTGKETPTHLVKFCKKLNYHHLMGHFVNVT